jgi:hypothetical protein
MTSEFLVLSQRDLREVMGFADYAEAVTEGFQLLAERRCESPVPTEIPVQYGTFHIKARDEMVQRGSSRPELPCLRHLGFGKHSDPSQKGG